METLAAAVAAIPPASHIVKHLHLKSRLPRRDGDVTVCTQCSLDRLERLYAQTSSWSGVICAAVMCPCPCIADSLRAAKRCVRAIHASVEARGGPCRLDIILVGHVQRRGSVLLSCSDPWQYPINALRNVALHSAATELVMLLDVDFLPGVGIQEQLWKMDVYHGYFRTCTDLRRVVVLPAFEESSASETANTESSSGNKDYIHRALQIVTKSKANVVKLWTQGKLRAFAAEKYPPGHGLTDTTRWVSSVASYEVQYEIDYEPYFLCARRLVPWYDERFTGYGKNKTIHAFHVAVLDFRFWVHPEWYVVHIHHDDSIAWQATLGSDPLASQRFSDLKLLYAGVKHELVSHLSHSGVCLSLGTCANCFTQVPSNTCCSWKIGQDKCVEEEPMGHWSRADKPSSLLLQMSTKEYLQALYDLRYHFCVPELHPVVGIWPLRSKLPRKVRDISLVTVATSDRLQCLSAQCRQWKGVICAAIYAPHNANVKALEKQLIELHLEVEKAGACRLDLILLKSSKVDKGSYCSRGPTINACYQSRGSRAISSDDLCPINALRNAALGLATTDLVLLLDVDLLPAPSLNECFLDEQQYKCLWRMTVEQRTAVVVPSFEFAIPSLDTWTRDENSAAGNPSSHLATDLSSGFEMGEVQKTAEKESKFEEGRSILYTEEIISKGVQAICKGLTMGDLKGFHVNHYPTGHGPTDFQRWRENCESNDMGVRPCCQICTSYTVTFAEGFEPFAICARKLIPKFDERFRGYGYDKVTFFYHFHLKGFGFRVLLHTFAVDIPHPKSPDWVRTFGPDSDPLQHVRVRALYQRAKRELGLVTGVSALANKVTDLLPALLIEQPTQSAPLPPSSYNQGHVTDTMRGRYKGPTLEGLQLKWQGVIRPVCGCHKPSSECHQGEESSCAICHGEELRTFAGSGVAEPSQGNHVSKRLSLRSKEDEMIDPAVESKRTYFSGCRGWKNLWALRMAHATDESDLSHSSDRVKMLPEFEWDSAGWELKCNTDSLANCSVVKALQKEYVGESGSFDIGGYWLRVSMSAGSWSPQASRLAGITTGGVSVRSLLPIRAVKTVVVRYMVRFPISFEWVKGGTLPGLWISDVLQINFGWRRAGEGNLSSSLIGRSHTESGLETNCKNVTKVSRPFYFVPGQWHALQLAVSVVNQAGDQAPGVDVQSMKAMAGERSLSRHSLDFEGIQDGAVVEVQGFVDSESVSKITYLPCKQSPPNMGSEPGAALGLLLSCYFGGKTQEWATTEDTHLDFSQFEVWTNEGR